MLSKARKIQVKLLVDTCTFLWLATDDSALSRVARAVCRNPANPVFLSALSAFEIAIKYRLGRLPLPETPGRYVLHRREWLQIHPLPFQESAAEHEAQLPPHHRDPFDRGLIAQAIQEGMTIVTPDPVFSRYPVPLLW